jgi:hypothetical protein
MKKILAFAIVGFVTFGLFGSVVIAADSTESLDEAIGPRPFLDEPFYDVYEHHYPHAISYLRYSGTLSMYSKKNFFRPSGMMTRGEFLEWIVFLSDFSTELWGGDDSINMSYREQCFADVGPGSPYVKSICFAKEKGLIRGMKNSDGLDFFYPSRPVNAAEAMTMIGKVFEDRVEDAGSNPWFFPFIDANADILPNDVNNFSAPLKRFVAAEILYRKVAWETSVERTCGTSQPCSMLKDFRANTEAMKKDFLAREKAPSSK